MRWLPEVRTASKTERSRGERLLPWPKNLTKPWIAGLSTARGYGERVRFVRPTLILIALLVGAVPAVGEAGAASGGLRFVECLTGKTPYGGPRTPRGGGCNLTRTVAGDGEGTAVNHLSALSASPDGRSLNAVSYRDDAVSAFTPRPLRMTQCFTTNSGLRPLRKQPCVLLPNPGTGDVNSGFNGVHYVAVSPDGRDVYTASSDDDSIATFARAPSGHLSFVGCITGELGSYGSAANGSCRPIPSAVEALGGTSSGLGGMRSLVISPDGRFVYASVGGEAGVATLARGADGSLQFVNCLRGAVRYAEFPGGIHSPCPLVAPEKNNPNGSGLTSTAGMAISADGRSLYATSAEGASIAEFRRDPASGALTFSGCLSAANRGSGPGDPCRYVPQANDIGVDTAMYGMREIAITPDGTGLYGVSTYDNAVAAFARNPATGRLSFASCVAAESNLGKVFGVADPCHTVPAANQNGQGSGLRKPRGLAISPNGRSLFVASRGDSAINRFRLKPGGGLRLAGCITSDTAAIGPCTRARTRRGKLQWLGFDGFNSLAVIGHNLYAAAGDGSSISRFSFP
jgi:6-phosphogluconolactonase (cycloisomerase 2 family)